MIFPTLILPINHSKYYQLDWASWTRTWLLNRFSHSWVVYHVPQLTYNSARNFCTLLLGNHDVTMANVVMVTVCRKCVQNCRSVGAHGILRSWVKSDYPQWNGARIIAQPELILSEALGSLTPAAGHFVVKNSTWPGIRVNNLRSLGALDEINVHFHVDESNSKLCTSNSHLYLHIYVASWCWFPDFLHC